MGKLNPEQLKQRRRNAYLKEINPEWVKYQKQIYAIDDKFDEIVKNLHTSADVDKYFEAITKARKEIAALVFPTTKMWKPEYDPFPDGGEES